LAKAALVVVMAASAESLVVVVMVAVVTPKFGEGVLGGIDGSVSIFY
jgi:hypothetical protein